MIFENTGSIVARVNYGSSIRQRFQNLSLDTPIYSVIAIGADIYIDDSVIPEDDGQPRALISIKNEQ